ncbi:hypothetical protein [Nocardioides terrisoli]|uniref:hypothetical protein n=1 Tax=Nocardioides terrisoli TaxID=3388267 RepID=UPI00287B8D72|nr:hypothetical protein [Nocardioides marmorisolisilvae]
MVVPPQRGCVPIEVESISLHREHRPPRRPARARQDRWFGSWVRAVVRAAAGRSRT